MFSYLNTIVNKVYSLFPVKKQEWFHEVKKEIFSHLYKYQFPKEIICLVDEYFFQYLELYNLLTLKNQTQQLQYSSLSIWLNEMILPKHYCFDCKNQKFNLEYWMSHIPSIYQKYQPLIGQQLVFWSDLVERRDNLGLIYSININADRGDLSVSLKTTKENEISVFNTYSRQIVNGYYWTKKENDIFYKPIIELTPYNVHNSLENDYVQADFLIETENK